MKKTDLETDPQLIVRIEWKYIRAQFRNQVHIEYRSEQYVSIIGVHMLLLVLLLFLLQEWPGALAPPLETGREGVRTHLRGFQFRP